MPVSQFGIWDLKGPDKLWQLVVLGTAEALGTATLLFLGCASALPNADNSEPSLLYVAITFGFAICIVVMGIGHISGAHINPAVSTAALVLGKLSPVTFLVYIASQCFGALVGMQTIMVSTSGNITAEYCVNKLSSDISPIKGVLIECILTAILVLLVCSAWDPKNSDKHDSVSLRFGAGIIALVLAGARFTGCSMNPARSFAPTILSGYWKDHWVYWIGPLSGGLLMSLLYKYMYMKNDPICKNKLNETEFENEPLTKKNTIALETVVSNDNCTKPSSEIK
ncbi:aquaporin-like [Lycorma delicatula]|uniref:aquaporin-like n=1 Tax=Lycorma delicatula TaxID=130591 RepID=UPI003F517C6E